MTGGAPLPAAVPGPAQAGPLLGSAPLSAALQVVALALVAAAVTLLVSFLLRLRTRTEISDGVAILVGVGTVTLLLNTRHVLVQYLGGTEDLLTPSNAATNVVTLVAAAAASVVANQLGIRFATSEWLEERSFRFDMSPLVRAAGRAITVTLPEEIRDVEGYDPIPDETREKLEGETLDFPRGLTVEELEERLALRLREEHAVGYVDAELEEDGTLTYLGLGYRPAGLGPTLPPGSAAVAVRADPPVSATPGDLVQIWRGGPEPERVGTGELRAAAGDVATVAVDEEAAIHVDPEVEHRLVTLPGDSHPEREFASALRRADETLGIVGVPAGSPLAGAPIGSLEATVIAVQTPDGAVETLPSRSRTLAPGENLFVLGPPTELRRLEERLGPPAEGAAAPLEEAREAVDPAPEDPAGGSHPGDGPDGR